MRTTIVIDDKLMSDALEATGLKTKHEVVEEALRTLLSLRSARAAGRVANERRNPPVPPRFSSHDLRGFVRKQSEIRQFRGKLEWHGDLDAMRRDS
jgi:hypothetical protein